MPVITASSEIEQKKNKNSEHKSTYKTKKHSNTFYTFAVKIKTTKIPAPFTMQQFKLNYDLKKRKTT